MKKGKKIWNRLLSLVLCLVMVTSVFAGMGMEADAEEKKVVLYKASSGITFTDGSWITKDIDMILYDSAGKYDIVQWKSGSGATTNLSDIVRIEFYENNSNFNSDGIDPKNYYIHPTYNTYGQHSIIVWPACKLNITLGDYEGNAIKNQHINIKWNRTD